MPAFAGTPPGWVASTLLCALATVLDAALALALHGFGVWAFRDRLWFRPPRPWRYVVVVLVAIVRAVVIPPVVFFLLARWVERDKHRLDVGSARGGRGEAIPGACPRLEGGSGQTRSGRG